MKHLNNSQPLAVATQYAPLSTYMHIVVKGGLSTVQFYRQNQQEWLPDHTHAERYNDIGALVDGPITLRAEYSIIDKDGLIRDGALVPQVYWFVDGKQITDTDKEKDFYITGSRLVIRKNFTHLQGAVVVCECRFTDTRTGSPFVLSDTLPLSAVLQADEQWSINILSDRTLKHFPLQSASTVYTFEAEARLGSTDKTGDVKWFWDYSIDSGSTWKVIDDTCLWYVSGKDSHSLTVDADFIEHVTLRCRIADGDASGPNLPNEATASIAWRYPNLQPVVFCYGGDKVLADTKEMKFGLIVHCGGRSDLSTAEQREWLLCDWCYRIQGSSALPVRVPYFGIEATILADAFKNTENIKYIVDPRTVFRGPWTEMQMSDGRQMQMSDGRIMVFRA